MTSSTKLRCHACFDYIGEPRVSWKEFSNGTMHIEARCPRGHFLKWLPQTEPWLSMLPSFEEPGPR